MPRSKESPTRSRRWTSRFGGFGDCLLRSRSGSRLGDLKTARAAAAELEQLVDSYKTGSPPCSGVRRHRSMSLSAGSLSPKATRTRAVRRLRQARDDWRRGWRAVRVRAGSPAARGRVPAARAKSTLRRRSSRRRTPPSSASARRRTPSELHELLGRQQPRRTFLFTDIVGSTRLLETLGDEKWRKLLERHNVAARGADSQQRWRGRAADGRRLLRRVRHSEGGARGCRRHSARARGGDRRAGCPDRSPHRRRIPERRGPPTAYGGGAVHLAARIGASAGAGEILASHETVEGAGTGFRTSDPRPEAFKGFADPVDVISVDWK